MAIARNSSNAAGGREVIIASASGFCGGVESAVQKALDVVKNRPAGRVFLDGELVHNRTVSERLFSQGIQLLGEHSKVEKEDTIIIRAHGITPQRRSYLEHFGCKIVDCTCPLVRRISKIIEAHSGKQIILLGDRNHAEVEGLCGYSKNIHICESLAELSQFIDAVRQNDRIDENIFDHRYASHGETDDWILVCQSTLDVDFLKAARNLCNGKHFPVKIFDTICAATKRHQKGLEALKNCDAVIVVGGFHSANTKRLFEKMKQKIAAVFWIEDIADLAEINLDTYKKIGITAGASTPQDVLQGVRDKISKKIA
ncbi:MAG: 4-hydroxy-3-methylbut-2-enyl diphosphate reductase [Puniceicoccales bacterium]|jgi:4-hydroxy-3-methylbut-2-enyl diphosphate reductase|nr:4-hydroxy-3-methylbut-2-enyl diphosphate reductase [Puniceicoccales bacterium]